MIDQHSDHGMIAGFQTWSKNGGVLEHSVPNISPHPITGDERWTEKGVCIVEIGLLRDTFNFREAQGIGMVVPIFATYDANSKPEALCISKD